MTDLRKILIFLLVSMALLSSGLTSADESLSPLKFYLDSDRSNHTASAIAIERGVRTALAEVNNKVQGRHVELVLLDHRGNSTRSKKNMQQYLSDPFSLVYFGGLHSPPLIQHRAFINENSILTLVPWAAGGPITRYPNKDNWVFRLSIDDSKAGFTLIRFAVQELGCKSPYLLLEATAWGDSNKKTMTKALQEKNIKAAGITRFGWNTNLTRARTVLREATRSNADCLMLVGNALEGAVFARAMLSLPEAVRIPIVSHWGIVGGSFHESITADLRKQIDLYFIQSCFSFMDKNLAENAKSVLLRAKKLFDDVNDAVDITAPSGFIHAYDITKLLLQAIDQVVLENDMVKNKRKVRLALENIQGPVLGLVKKYKAPYSVFDENNIDAHEALGIEDFCMAQYGTRDEIKVLDWKPLGR